MPLACSTMSRSGSTMTTPTPTGENRVELTPESGQLAGLPDISTLVRWSNEFFRAAPANPAPGAQNPAVAPVASVGAIAPVPAVPITPPFGMETLLAAAAAAALPRMSAEDLARPPLPEVPGHRPPP